MTLQNIEWIETGYDSSILTGKKGQVILGPGKIYVWGKFPYLYGNIQTKSKHQGFLIDLRNESVVFGRGSDLGKEYGIPWHSEQFKTFSSLKNENGCLLLKEILHRSLKPDFFLNSDNKNSRIPYADLFWKPVEGGNSIIVDGQGRALIGPGLITLWGRYPYLYGRIWMKPQFKFFVLNVETKKVEESPLPYELFQKYHLPDNLVDLFRWEEIMGDWPGSVHAQTLLKEAMSPNQLTPEKER